MTRINPDGWIDTDVLSRGELGALDRKQADALHVSADQTVWGTPELINATLENATCEGNALIGTLTTPEGVYWAPPTLTTNSLSCDSVIDSWSGGGVINDTIPSAHLLMSPWTYSSAPLGGGLFVTGWFFNTGTANTSTIVVIPSRCLSHGGALSSITAQFYTATPASGETLRIRLFHGSTCLSSTSSSTFGSNLFSASTNVPSGTLVDKDSGQAYWLEVTSSIAASIVVFLLKIQISYTQYAEPSWVRGGG